MDKRFVRYTLSRRVYTHTHTVFFKSTIVQSPLLESIKLTKYCELFFLKHHILKPKKVLSCSIWISHKN